ncbi:MAG TPA: intein-containing adenosylcobalamin-dependent ribonucleoside-diphosphate reductase, partial [Rhodothermales bacterium]|nr:intein-containing adenosylcobalamin-dependent ribonucleoside-diphosphate reductase [Rhodothermales bacterium]
VYKPTRRRLPDERPSLTHKFSVAGHEGYLHVGLYPDTKKPGEIFITMAKQGSTISGMMDAFATAISLALQYGVPVDALCEKFSHMRFEPSGFTHNPQIPMAKSITDYIFRWMALKFVGHEVEEAEDPFHFTNPPDLSDGSESTNVNELAVSVHVDTSSGVNPLKSSSQTAFQNQADAPGCPSCGSITVRSGSCYKCMNCGTTTGCS